MKNFELRIAKKSDGLSYGHSETSVSHFLKMASAVQAFLKGKTLRDGYKEIRGIKVSNSGCNIWLIVLAREGLKETLHTIETSQNAHLAKFGIASRQTDLHRFIDEKK